VPDSIEASDRMVSDWNRRLQESAQRYQAMADRVSEISVTERSKDAAIEVTINSKGLLMNLTIAESAQGRRMAELSGQIMATVQRAQSRIPELLQQAMAETVGTTDQTVNRVFDEARKQFPAPPEDDLTPPSPQREMRFGPEEEELPPGSQAPPSPKPQARPRRRPAADDDDDDFGGRTFLS
jgi:DNA-binding protein YbaB